MGYPHRRRTLLRAGYRQPTLRYGAQRGGPAPRRGDGDSVGFELERAVPRPGKRDGPDRQSLRPCQHLRSPHALLHSVPAQRAARTRREHGPRSGLHRLGEPQARIAAVLQRPDPISNRVDSLADALSGAWPDPGGRRQQQGELQLVEREIAAPVLAGSDLPLRLYLVPLDRLRKRDPSSWQRPAVPPEWLRSPRGARAVELPYASPVCNVCALRASHR